MAQRRIDEWRGRAVTSAYTRSVRDDVRLTLPASSAEAVPHGR